jgi:hypothetical protein
MDWQQVRQQAGLWLNRAAQFWLAQTVLVYLWACIVANRPVGPKDYVRFSYYVVQWHPGQSLEPSLKVLPYLSER